MLNPVDFNFGAHKRMNSLVLKSVMNEWKSYILNIWHLQRNKTMGLTWEKFEISLSGIYKKHIIRNMEFLQTIQQKNRHFLKSSQFDYFLCRNKVSFQVTCFPYVTGD